MKLRASAKFALVAGGITGAYLLGNFVYTKIMLAGVQLTPISTSKFSLFALDRKAGVRILNANNVASLAVVKGDFAGTAGGEEEGISEGGVKTRVPVRELVAVMNGDSSQVGEFVNRLRERTDDTELVLSAPLWKSEDLEKAFAGDPDLTPRLEGDLNMKLDGTPLPRLSRKAMFEGIRVEAPVTIQVNSAKGSSLTGRRQSMYIPRALKEVLTGRQSRDKFVTFEALQADWAEYAKKFTPKPETDQKTVLRGVIRQIKEDEAVQLASQIGGSTRTLINESMVESARFDEDREGQKVTYNLTLNLTDEGRKRLWKFSVDGGNQLLVIFDGVPIAAPFVGTTLASRELVIRQIGDRSLVEATTEHLQTQARKP